MYQVNLVENYMTNVDEVISLAEQHLDKFTDRGPGNIHSFKTNYGHSKMKSLFYFNMSEELKNAVFKTIPDDREFVSTFTINRYEPGDYLIRHKDSSAGYWKFKLIFLRSDKSHFKYYDEQGIGHIVDEKPGAYLDMPVHLEHEVTEIGADEQPKYSLVLTWGRI